MDPFHYQMTAANMTYFEASAPLNSMERELAAIVDQTNDGPTGQLRRIERRSLVHGLVTALRAAFGAYPGYTRAAV